MTEVSDLLGIVSRGRALSPRSQILYMLALAAVSEGQPFPSVPALAGQLAIRERRVEQCLAELVAAGEVVKVSPGVWTLVK
jgi:DNA-binding transcriptional regulator YhcF (GntR family)